MIASNLQGMIVSNPINIRYLTGLTAEGTLLIAPKGNAFITDSRYLEAVNSYLTIDQEIIAYDMKNLNKYDYEGFFDGCENVGFEEGYVTYEVYKAYLRTYQVNLVETERIIELHRMVKEEYEIDSIRKACIITDRCYEHLKEYIKLGMTEKEIAFEIEKFMRINGADGLAFDTIVASGPNSSMPHAVPTDRKIEAKDIIQFDFGCKVNGYCSDFSRVLFIGEITEEEEKIYNFVFKIYDYILKNLTEGGNVKEILKKCEQDYKNENYDLLHSFGHSLGLDIHEEPILSCKYETKLKKNMVVTIEPGVYIPRKFGIRIEDTVLINKNGCNTLTKSGVAVCVIKS
jgi:Xaa-Pro aminopeptidase